jgi:PAS domain S-box-containing protein
MNTDVKNKVMAGLSVIGGAAGTATIVATYKTVWGYGFKLSVDLVPIIIGGLLGLACYSLGFQTRLVSNRLTHLNLVLKTIRDINKLMTREKDRQKLIQEVCKILVTNRGYHSAWIALRDGQGRWTSFSEYGLGDEFAPVLNRLEKGDTIACSQRALKQKGVVVSERPLTLCGDCPLIDQYDKKGALSSRIENGGKVYGVITLSIAKTLVNDDEERVLVKDIADDIAYGLYNLEIQERRKQTESALRTSMEALADRIKELNCLFGVSRLVERRHITLEEIMQGVLALIPPAWQFPEITCARIQFNQTEFRTDDFRETGWKLDKEIVENDRAVGHITVCYLAEKPDRDEGPFLAEERALINALAERLGAIIERKEAEEELLKREYRFRALIENSLTGISIIQDGRIVYQNKEQDRLFGPLPRAYVLGDHQNIHPQDAAKVKRLSYDFFAGKLEELDLEFRYLLKGDPSKPIWVHCRAHPIEYRQKKAVLVNMMDMTQIKDLEKMLLIQDRMASLGRVAAGIAHEIRNPLSGINIYLNTLQKLIHKNESEETLKNVIQQVLSASRKIESVIRRVMDFSKPSKPNYVVADLNQTVEEALKLTAVTLRKSRIVLERDLADHLPRCHLDPQQIEEVVLNLLNNAVDAMRGAVGDRRVKVVTFEEDRYVILQVSDSGPGIPAEHKDKVFDPFFTSKPDSTGIGLSICHRIISDHGGRVEVRSGPWGGAEFSISIPAENARGEPPSAGECRLAGENGRIKNQPTNDS